MNAHESRQYQMLLRVRDFGHTHRDRFPNTGLAGETFAALDTVIVELAATDTTKRSASASARSGHTRTARNRFVKLLGRGSQTTRVLREAGEAIPPFTLRTHRTDYELLSAARQFAQAAAPFEAAFVAHGLLPSSITDAARAFETVLRTAGMRRDDHTAARVRIRQLLASASAYIRILDVIVGNHLGADMLIQAIWKQARHIDEPRRRRRKATTAGVATPQPDAAPAAAA